MARWRLTVILSACLAGCAAMPGGKNIVVRGTVPTTFPVGLEAPVAVPVPPSWRNVTSCAAEIVVDGEVIYRNGVFLF